jgi:hypothetical protein
MLLGARASGVTTSDDRCIALLDKRRSSRIGNFPQCGNHLLADVFDGRPLRFRCLKDHLHKDIMLIIGQHDDPSNHWLW